MSTVPMAALDATRGRGRPALVGVVGYGSDMDSTPTEPFGLLVIGSGPAGVHAATAYVEAGGPGRVGLVSADVDEPYQRPPLSKAVLSRQGAGGGDTDPRGRIGSGEGRRPARHPCRSTGPRSASGTDRGRQGAALRPAGPGHRSSRSRFRERILARRSSRCAASSTAAAWSTRWRKHAPPWSWARASSAARRRPRSPVAACTPPSSPLSQHLRRPGSASGRGHG